MQREASDGGAKGNSMACMGGSDGGSASMARMAYTANLV